MSSDIESKIEDCLLQKLATDFREDVTHDEFDYRSNDLQLKCDLVIRSLPSELSPSIIAKVLILYKELQSKGSWNTEDTSSFAKKLSAQFQLLFGINVDSTLQSNDLCDSQEIFDICIMALHEKLSNDEFRKYPAQIEVYASIVNNLQEYNVSVNLPQTMPLSLLLIDDYIHTNKLKGLQCCSSILKCLKKQNFENGNYYDVIYESLKKRFTEKDLQITALVLECCLVLIKLLPSDIQKNKMDNFFSSVLHELLIESNLHRKEKLFRYTKVIIDLHQIHCAKQKVFMDIIGDNLEISCNEGVAEILLQPTIQCLESWIRYCWCVWQLYFDRKVISVLLKSLYVNRNQEAATSIQVLLVVMITLCRKKEQIKMMESLQKLSTVKDSEFNKKIEFIKNGIGTRFKKLEIVSQ